MKKSLQRKVSFLLAAVMLLTAFVFTTTAGAAQTGESTAAQSYGLPDKIEDGAILHCWCWNFATIKENLPKIAEAGFKSIQTSPINAFQVGDGGKMSLMSTSSGKWWYQYQTTDYTIGNYMLGTKEEFMDMCAQAHKLGVKVIVDIVANHCSSDYSVISSHVKNIGGKAFHDRVEISDWSNRYQVTQGKLTGLWDLNTQNPAVQQMIVDYLAEVLAAGADGFRFDAAKHIELPDDDDSYKSDFWPTVLDNDAEFQYGEILSGADRTGAYAEMMRVTAEDYGSNLQASLSRNSLSVAGIQNYRAYDEDKQAIAPGRLVTWVESHDNYCGDAATWSLLSNEMINQGWAAIASQGDTTPLFFARPQGSSTTNQWGTNKMGIAGDGNYYSDTVAAINHFRNAMVGESKNVVSVVKKKVDLIERGTKGAVVINVSVNDNTINVATNLAEGEYTDHVSGELFTVKDGKLSGTVKAGQVAVLYTPEEEPDVLIGDVNGDGKVTIEDATLLQRYLADFKNPDGSVIVDVANEKQFAAADADGNGKLNISDVTKIQRIIAEYE